MTRASVAKKKKLKALTDRFNAINNDQFQSIAKTMATYPPPNNLTLDIQFRSSSSLTSEQHESIYRLTETNMRTLYESCDWGWNEKEKREELTHQDARYLYVTSTDPIHSNNQCLAFAHIRFELEDSIPVLYLYELQIEQSIQSIGLGRHLMSLLDLIGRLYDFDCVMLTCFKHNDRAMKFYLKCGFEKDEFSPDDKSYLILSKPC